MHHFFSSHFFTDQKQFWFHGVIILFALGAGVVGLWSPLYNWDLIPYVACVRSWSDSDPSEVHRYAFDAVRGYIPETMATRDAIPAADIAFRQRMKEDPTAFSHVMSFYRARVLYIGSMWVLLKAGISPVTAANLVSAVCLSVGLLVLHWLCTRYLAFLSHSAVILWTVPAGVFHLSRLSSPDAMLMVLTMVLVLALLEGSRWMFAILFLMVLTRTDAIVFILLLMVILFLLDRDHRKRWIVGGLFSVASVIVLHRVTGYPGWEEAFRFTFLGKGSAAGDLSMAQYFNMVLRGSGELVHRKVILISGAAVLGLTAAVWRKRRDGKEPEPLLRVPLALFWGSAISILIRMMLFPLPDLRFFTASLIIIVLTGLIIAERMILPHLNRSVTPGSD